MNFSYGVIAAVGILVAISIGFIAASPDEIIEPRSITIEEKSSVSETMMVEEETETMMVEEETETMMVEEETETMMAEEETETMMAEEETETMMVEEEPEPVAAESTESASTVSTISVPAGSGVPGCEETDECYLPFETTVPAGTTITWTNDDSAAHTVTSGTVSDGPDGLFDSSIFMAGDIFEFTFDELGTYDYFCIVHPWMVGKVIVSDMQEISSDSETMMAEEETETMMAEEETETMMAEEETETMMAEEETETMMVEEEPEPVAAESTESASTVSTISVPAGSGVPGCEETDECYLPFETTVPAGTTITWTNDDSAAHTVTSGTVEAGLTGIFDSGLFMAGDNYEFTFTESGKYDYFCMVHPWMVGIVNIS